MKMQVTNHAGKVVEKLRSFSYPRLKIKNQN